jgi:peptide/nickel transport system ATP-binding protein
VSDVLEISDVSVSFSRRSGLLGRSQSIRVVDNVSLTVGAGEVVALVGESGSGKSTLARAALRLVPLDGGKITLNGADISTLSQRALRPHRQNAQLVFQDPYSSLDPSMTAIELVEESLLGSAMNRAERRRSAQDLLASVGLAGVEGRYPYEFSGGQRQRIAIARALAPEPTLVVCDEPVSALDLSTQNQIISLLDSLRDRLGVSYLFISHDLSVVRRIADRVAVMYAGEIVEEGPTERVFREPAHPYTLALLSAVPVVSADRSKRARRIVLEGDLPVPGDPPPGCRFHTRCPFAMDVCRSVPPEWSAFDASGSARCHLHTPGQMSGFTSVSQLALDSLASKKEN